MADLACAIVDGTRVISDFQVMSDQRELFGVVASVSTGWRCWPVAEADFAYPIAGMTLSDAQRPAERSRNRPIRAVRGRDRLTAVAA
jgi:hypothetical protein